jgi:hypothetical protein
VCAQDKGKEDLYTKEKDFAVWHQHLKLFPQGDQPSESQELEKAEEAHHFGAARTHIGDAVKVLQR